MPVLRPSRWRFPDPATAGEDGLVGIGADLEPATLLDAYRRGIFPWPHPGAPLPWFSPDPRGVIPLDGVAVSRSLRARLRRSGWETTVDRAFAAVLAGCSDRPGPVREGGTWITGPMRVAYQRLHDLGHAHSLEVWAGGELVVWGGWTRDQQVHADGAAYDPRTGRWRPVPPAPQAQAFTVNDDRAAVWTGRELLLWGGYTPVTGARADGAMRPGDGLAYDPAAGRWRRLLPPPGVPLERAHAAGWTGTELLVVDAGTWPPFADRLRGAAYDPAADRWRRLAPSPRLDRGELLERTVLWAGTRLLVWSFLDRPGPAAAAPGEPDTVDLWAYDPAADRWTVLASPSARTRPLLARSSLAWTGSEILAVQHTSVLRPDPAPFAGRYDPDRDRWAPIADPPLRVDFRAPGALVWTGAALVAGGSHAYDPTGDRWWPLPAPGRWTITGQAPPVRRLGGGELAVLVPAAR